VRVGAVRMDEGSSLTSQEVRLAIGEPTAKRSNTGWARRFRWTKKSNMEIQGRDQVAGLPRTIRIRSTEITEALQEPLSAIVGVVKSVLEKTPPELASDIIDRGMALVGGGALLRKIDQLITKETAWPPTWPKRDGVCAMGAARRWRITRLSDGHWWVSRSKE